MKTFIPKDKAARMDSTPAGEIFVDGKLELTVVGSLPPMCDARTLRRVFERTLGPGWDQVRGYPADADLLHVDDRSICSHGVKQAGPNGLALCKAVPERTIMRTSGFQLDNPDWRMRILVTAGDFGPDGCWQHASISRHDRIPSYDELKVLHAAAFGPDAWSYQVFTPTKDHVNIHSHALHLFGRIDGSRALPNFGALGTI